MQQIMSTARMFNPSNQIQLLRCFSYFAEKAINHGIIHRNL